LKNNKIVNLVILFGNFAPFSGILLPFGDFSVPKSPHSELLLPKYFRWSMFSLIFHKLKEIVLNGIK
jgi:hypothetical protein